LKKNVLYIIQADTTTGSGKCATVLINALKSNADFNPIVITQHENDINDYCNQNNIENYSIHYARTCSLGMGIIGWIIAFFMRPIINFNALKRLKKAIDIHRINIIHSNDSSIDFGAYLYKKLNVLHVWHVREFLVFQKTLFPIIHNLPKYINNNSTSIVTVSKSLKKYLIRHDVQESKIQTIYDGIVWNKENTPKSKTSKLRIVCLGAICKEKGQDILIDALGLIPQEIVNKLQVDFWGNINDNKFKEYLDKKISNNHLKNIVSFCGYSSNIPQLLQEYDIGIQTSHSEGFSLVTAEYMRAGLCVIAANEGAIPELIEDKKNGLLYNDYSPQELGNKIISCFEHQELINLYGENAKRKAQELYTIERNIQEILDLYKSILAN